MKTQKRPVQLFSAKFLRYIAKYTNYFQTGILMKPTTFVLGALLIFFACKREEDKLTEVITKVHGHLMVLGTEEIINDRPYKMVLKRVMSNDIYDETYTDENGFYEFTHHSYRDHNGGAKDVYEIVLGENLPDETFTGGMPLFLDTMAEFSHPNNYSTGYKGRGAFSSGYQSWANVALEKKAWLELHVENIDPEIGDRISIDFIHYRGPGTGWKQTFFDGQNFKIVLPGVGNYRNLVQYTVKVGDDFVGKYEQILLGEMDTTYFKLEY